MNNHKKIIAELISTGKWDQFNAEIGISANFKCEYCGKDLLASVENYREWQKDHIIPLSKGGSGKKDNKDNIALACRTCNVNVKSQWNPEDIVGKNATRKEKIEAVRKYVIHKRTELLEEVSYCRKIVFG
ncbi:MAG: HNH endonuclease signature motif containing protein [Candidatus Pacebacteria bacterium]|jgi:5-methylcytosine-specific restriction endonuclease McrA|nr:HNH endonuclease signature motif containing protein [Candidatus Paceibacterota bacterium]|tara:strand:+ start:104 stop:493 length:390 start_codon:yes stop_codon:yes gene_type:complete